METIIRFDCDTCKIFPCIFIEQGESKELKGECMGYKVDMSKLINELKEIANEKRGDFKTD
jgi:hypothetical protein